MVTNEKIISLAPIKILHFSFQTKTTPRDIFIYLKKVLALINSCSRLVPINLLYYHGKIQNKTKK